MSNSTEISFIRDSKRTTTHHSNHMNLQQQRETDLKSINISFVKDSTQQQQQQQQNSINTDTSNSTRNLIAKSIQITTSRNSVQDNEVNKSRKIMIENDKQVSVNRTNRSRSPATRRSRSRDRYVRRSASIYRPESPSTDYYYPRRLSRSPSPYYARYRDSISPRRRMAPSPPPLYGRRRSPMYRKHGSPSPPPYQRRRGSPSPPSYQRSRYSPSSPPYQRSRGSPSPSSYRRHRGSPSPTFYQRRRGSPSPSSYKRRRGSPPSSSYQRRRPTPPPTRRMAALISKEKKAATDKKPLPSASTLLEAEKNDSKQNNSTFTNTSDSQPTKQQNDLRRLSIDEREDIVIDVEPQSIVKQTIATFDISPVTQLLSPPTSIMETPINKNGRLPKPWRVKMDDTGEIYYHNPVTGEDTFNRPE